MTRSNSQYKVPINLFHRATKPVNRTSSIDRSYCDLCTVQADLNVSSEVQEIHKKFVHLVFQFYT